MRKKIKKWIFNVEHKSKGNNAQRKARDFDKEGIMKLINLSYVPGMEIQALGLVKGNTVQSKHIGKDIGASFKTIVGGEIAGYTDMLKDARQVATQRMVDEAEMLGADAVINVRFASSAIMQGAAEVIAYGTAVKFVK